MKKYCNIELVFKKIDKCCNIIDKSIIDNLLKMFYIDYDTVEYYYYDSKNQKKISKVYSFKNIIKIYSLLDVQKKSFDENSIIGLSFYKKMEDKSIWPDYGIGLYIFKNYIKVEIDIMNTIISLDFINQIIKLLNTNNLIISNGFVYYYSKKRINWMIRGIYVDFMWPSEIIFTKKMEEWLINPIVKLPDIYYINIISKEFINNEKLNQLKKTIKFENFLENNNYICFIGFESKSKIKRIIGEEKFV